MKQIYLFFSYLLIPLLLLSTTGCTNHYYTGLYRAKNGHVYYVDEQCVKFTYYKDRLDGVITCKDPRGSITGTRVPLTRTQIRDYLQQQQVELQQRQLQALQQIQLQQIILLSTQAINSRSTIVDLSLLALNALSGLF
jgi:hypothetical protein